MQELFPTLSKRSSSGVRVDNEAFTAGEKDGQSIVIHRPLAEEKPRGEVRALNGGDSR